MCDITCVNVYDFLESLGFKLKNGTKNTYNKKYHGYEVKITIDKDDFKNSKIDYGKNIIIDRKTTINFSQQENFVVLECINRLLDKGYEPDKIILEKSFQVGKKEGGNLDVQVLDKENKSFLMIECKTFGKEYEKEVQKTRSDGGQIFSYFNQDKDTKYLCLYASSFDDEKISYKNSIIKVDENMKTSAKRQEAYENWKPQIFEEKGIFEEDVQPYLIKFKSLIKNDLEPLTKSDGGNIFNAFAEILRRNVVSDKTNAYNKIFNLFLCKIVDEYERNDDEELEFQWREGEENEEVLLKLNDLYKRGMEKYLDVKISSVTLEEITRVMNSLNVEKDGGGEIEKLFIQQKLYTSNDFAFREVFDKNTFDLNCIVVKEVVKLLEKYKIRYETKQQFLGDFFEKLLNTGIKQETGQFFTPVPIAQFISKSLPIWDIIKSKNDKGEIHILPYCIDYASGSGHFLTEIMGEINDYVTSEMDANFIKNGRAKDEFNSYKNNFNWVKEYVYGIEKDYRLAKTTKISTFLNGDGYATIICGDGLDNFKKSRDYKGKLKSLEDGKEINNFDIVVSNPPYSVSGFKTTIENGKDSFDLYDDFSDKSKEIECLFIERTKQLLKKGGVAGIILPSSILSNAGIYSKTRELILENFEIKGVVELGPNTFMATGTNTVILFLKKTENKKNQVSYFVDKSFNEKNDLTINGIEKPISKFLKLTYKINFSDFVSLLNGKPNEKMTGLDVFKTYAKIFMKKSDTKTLTEKTDFRNFSEKERKDLCEFIIKSEKDKIIYFILTYGKKVVVSNIPTDKKEETKFLGYKFSNRRGREGINVFKPAGGKLYNPGEVSDKTKVNHYVLENFLDKENLEISEEADSIKIVDLNSMLEFNKAEENFEKRIYLNSSSSISKFKKDLKFERLGDKINVKIGGTPPRLDVDFFEGNNLWVSVEEIKGKEINDTKEKLTDEGVKNSSCKLIKKGTTLLSFNLSIGKTAIAGKDLYTNQAIAGLEIQNQFKKEVLDEYLYYFFSSKLSKPFLMKKNNNVFGKSLSKSFLEDVKIPFPDVAIQKKIVSELSEIDDKKEELRENVLKEENEIENLLEEIFGKHPKVKIKSLMHINGLISGKRPSGGVFQYDEGVVSLGGENVGKDGKLDLRNKNYVPDEFYEDNKNFEVKENDVLMCKDGSSGKVAMVDKKLNETFIINEHLFIMRGDEDKINQKWLFYSLFSDDIQNVIKERAKKTVQDGINRETLLDLEIPCPKKEIQDEIIKKIESKEKEMENLKELIENLDDEKEKVMSRYLLE